MRLQVVSSNSTYYWSVTNAAPAKPYLQISNQYLPLTTATRAGIKLKVQSGNTTYRAAVYESGYYNTTSAAVGNLSSTTALTRASTSATLTRASTSATLTRASTSATLTRASTSATLTRASTSATYTRASTSATLTRSSISGYATGSSTVNYTILGFTKVTTNIGGYIFYTNSQNYYYNRYMYAHYTLSAWGTKDAVYGDIIFERGKGWNNGACSTNSKNNFNKASYVLNGCGNGAAYNLDYIYEGGSYFAKAWVWNTLSTNANSTKSSMMKYGKAETWATASTMNMGNETLTSTSRMFPWTTWFFDNESTLSVNATSATGNVTTASVVWYNNIVSTRTLERSIQVTNLYHSSYPAWMTLTYTIIDHYRYREGRVRETINTFSTKQVTTATLTRSSISGYGTRSSISGYGTRSSISGYGTRSSISGYATRSSISGYGTRSSISGYGTRSSISGYSGKLSSSKWA